MNIRARVRARLSQRVPRVRPHPRSRLSSGRSHGQIRAPLSTASTAVRFAANASRCVLSHYAYAGTCVHRVRLRACDRSGAETPPLGDVSLVPGSAHTPEFGYTRDDFFSCRSQWAVFKWQIRTSQGERGIDSNASPRLFSRSTTVVLLVYVNISDPPREKMREMLCQDGKGALLLCRSSLSLIVLPRLKFVSPKVLKIITIRGGFKYFVLHFFW